MLVVLVGQPNSGKSAILSRLTSARVIASNYPGTTVEVARARMLEDKDVEILDTPGVYSLRGLTREQAVTIEILEGNPDLVLNVIDGTSLERHLSLTLALLQYLRARRIPVVIVINQIDRMREKGLAVDLCKIQERLGCRVVGTSAVTGEGIKDLVQAVTQELGSRQRARWGESGPFPDSPAANGTWKPFHRAARELAREVLVHRPESGTSLLSSALGWFDERLDEPLGAWAACALGLFGSWKFLSWALPFLEGFLAFALNPVKILIGKFLESFLPENRLAEVISHALPEGLVLPLSTVLPSMVLAYLLIALIEDTGLLGRYAVLGDSLMGAFNLPGQAVVPFMLGLGCRVPALLSTRILPTDLSRKTASVIIATLVPCTATTSLGLAVLARFRGNPFVPLGVIVASGVFVGQVQKAFHGGRRDLLAIELPPLRFPVLRNILVKTEMRLGGFFAHVLPLLVIMNVSVRLILAYGLIPSAGWLPSFSRKFLGIPGEALGAVLFTMLQRYLAPLFLMQLSLSPREATIAATMVALGFPCLPSQVALSREFGFGYVVLTLAVSTCLFLGWGMVLNLVLP
ncbi:MAG: ferrous iron transporter B [Candidatus Fermentithermobacillus carboniphilus]|uniref:Ferrous iron transporter B n=1 Tax=Candidatus Fermentithermobacillus carboniphilus TaxID=3085328 RepID=A0AAT9LC58_9FIRM|nr:MAG: ferrous iron transporter B [Candidatus Fermentithermobacillus carboniphilus]